MWATSSVVVSLLVLCEKSMEFSKTHTMEYYTWRRRKEKEKGFLFGLGLESSWECV